MTKINDGGPAFPVIWQNAGPDLGMSLRDYFAAQALVGIGTWSPMGQPDGTPIRHPVSLCNPATQADRAAWAYAQADAMLKAREVKP